MDPTPPSPAAFERRLKRHVIGRRHAFFVATAPGLEDICLQELNQLPMAGEALKKAPGGIEFEGRLSDCYLANLHLRTASRILMIIRSFKASNFGQFESRLRLIPWELYVRSTDRVQVHVRVSRCRLYHTRALSERATRCIADRLAQARHTAPQPEAGALNQMVFIRGKRDSFTVSIDSSGALLHRRGLKTHGGRAPIRETLAAAALMLAGFNGREPLIDPMCGSGTFSIEAALMAKRTPPGWQREFAFMRWPGFRVQAWSYLKKQAAEFFAGSTPARIYASDTGADACRRLERCAQANGLTDVMDVRCRNFFDFLPRQITEHCGCVVINPPYGRRMGNRRQSEALYRRICHHLQTAYQGWKVCLVVPSADLVRRTPFQLEPLTTPHGGLKIVLLAGKLSGG